MPLKKYAELETAVKAAVDDEIVFLQNRDKVTPDQARSVMLDMKKTRKLSLRALMAGEIGDLLQSPKAKQRWNEIAALAREIVAENKIVNASNFWHRRLLLALPEKTVMTGSTESGNKRQIGEITGVAALMKECKADEMEKRGEGLYEAFGEGTKALLEAFRAVDQDDTGFSNECHGQFTEAKKTEIALQKLIERNKKGGNDKRSRRHQRKRCYLW